MNDTQHKSVQEVTNEWRQIMNCGKLLTDGLYDPISRLKFKIWRELRRITTMRKCQPVNLTALNQAGTHRVGGTGDQSPRPGSPLKVDGAPDATHHTTFWNSGLDI